ncbi:hypothetical protein ABZ791_37695 [Streptomyces huasconensis]|uniref:Transcriptional regulator n=1 Tax=Streptomyces huasconensis TaxID=1854574 RepID=A0ABV3M799_9ACTN
MQRDLWLARTGFQAGHFAQLGVQIPKLLVDATRAAEHHQGDDQLLAYRYLSLTLELTEAAAIKWGDTELAVVAGHRAVAAAERSQDVVIMASAARHLADAMTNHGQAAAAVAFVTAAARRLEPDLLRRGPEGLSVLGMLFLKAAMAQATAAEADDHHPTPPPSPARSPASWTRPTNTPTGSASTATNCRAAAPGPRGGGATRRPPGARAGGG